MKEMAKDSLLADLYGSLGDAVADVRQKVVEEGYFGRAVTQLDIDAPQWPEAREGGPSFGSVTHDREMEPDVDIDR